MMILNCEHVHKSFEGNEVLKGISFSLEEKEFLTLLGPSGCGKTTLLRIIAGLEALNDGKVTVNNVLVSSRDTMLSPQQRKIGLVFQDVALFPHISVAQNIAFGLKGASRQEKQKRVEELLELINLPGYQNKYPHEISGGEQQRVALARALALNPKLILLDEPFSSLDAQLRSQVRDDLQRVLTEAGVSVILVTHDQSEAFAFSDRVLVLSGGRVVQEGAPAEIYQNPVSPWVARFVGESNFLPAERLKPLLENPENGAHLSPGTELLVRPEALSIAPASEDNCNGFLEGVKFGGDHLDLTVRLKDGGDTLHLITAPCGKEWAKGQPVQLGVKYYNGFQDAGGERPAREIKEK